MIKIPVRYITAQFADVPAAIRTKFETMAQAQSGSLYLHGAVGTGKTYIAYALAKQWDQQFEWIRFWNVTELMFEIKEDYGRAHEDRQGHAEKLLGFSGLVVLDDLGAEKATEFVAETIYMVINNRYNDNLPTLITSNLPVAELAARIGDRTASRITEMCEIFELGGSDRRLK